MWRAHRGQDFYPPSSFPFLPPSPTPCACVCVHVKCVCVCACKVCIALLFKWTELGVSRLPNKHSFFRVISWASSLVNFSSISLKQEDRLLPLEEHGSASLCWDAHLPECSGVGRKFWTVVFLDSIARSQGSYPDSLLVSCVWHCPSAFWSLFSEEVKFLSVFIGCFVLGKDVSIHWCNSFNCFAVKWNGSCLL